MFFNPNIMSKTIKILLIIIIILAAVLAGLFLFSKGTLFKGYMYPSVGSRETGASCTSGGQCKSSICSGGKCAVKNIGDRCTFGFECGTGYCYYKTSRCAENPAKADTKKSEGKSKKDESNKKKSDKEITPTPYTTPYRPILEHAN